VRTRIENEGQLAHGSLPDPEGQAIEDLNRRIDQLEQLVNELKDEKLSSRHIQ
jgi:hypothetical protein